jgi:hypothetical protein
MGANVVRQIDPARPARTVRAGEWLPDRPAPTVPDLSELDGMQKVRGVRIPLAPHNLFSQVRGLAGG